MDKRYILRLAMMASTAVIAAPTVAQAQAAAPGATLQEVVVTARKREETLLSAPVTVQALTAEDLARTPTTDLRELSSMVPNVTAGRTGSGAQGAYNIRGIGGANAGDTGVDQAVALVIDDVPISRGTAASASFFDLANVQVLPGPQSLYFGKNASGGVIALASAGPTSSFEAQAKTGYEFYARQRYVDGAVSGPLTDQLSGRLAFRFDEMDGWMHNDAGPVINPFESDPNMRLQPGASDNRIGAATYMAGRLTLAYQPTASFKATLKGTYSSYEADEASSNLEVIACSPGRTLPHTFDQVDPYGDCKADGHTSIGAMNPQLAQFYPKSNSGRGYSKAEGGIGVLKLEYTSGPLQFTSVTGFFHMNVRVLGNYTYAALNYFPGRNFAKEEQISQEVRVNTSFEGPLNFIVGAFISREDRNAGNLGRGLIYGFLPPVNRSTVVAGATLPLPNAIGYSTDYDAQVKTYSVFAEGTWNITDTLKLDAGARYTKVDGVGRARAPYVAPFYLSLFAGAATGAPCNSLGLPTALACLFVPPTDRVRIGYGEDNVSPEATLSWKPSQDLTLYAAYKTGYKPGGVSQPIVLLESNLTGDLEFGPEKSKGGEVGAKASLLGGNLRLISSIYYYKFSGLQLNTFNSTTTSFFIRNAGAAVTKGFEVQATYQATSELTLRGILDYNRGYYSDYQNAQCYNGQTPALGCNVPRPAGAGFLQDLTGAPLANAPRWVATGGFTWDHPLSNGLTLSADGDFKYSDKFRLNSTGSPRAVQGSYIKFNAQVRLAGPDDHWTVALIGRNLTNKHVVLGAVSKPGTGNAQDGFSEELTGLVERGREIALEARFRY